MVQVQEREASAAQKPLTGKVAVVTGGARGLGEAICRDLAGAGATVMIADVRGALAASTAAAIDADGGQAEAVEFDVTDERGVQTALDDIRRRHGSLDILVNNAGINVTKSIEDLSVAEWDAILNVNLRGPFVVSKAALPIMRAQGRGHIVNIISTAAKRAWANAAAYHASKWGALGFSHALHVEARAANVKVTALVAGGMKTPFLLEPFPDIDLSTLQDPENVARALRHVLLLPDGTVVPEMMVLPMKETSWP